VHWCDLFCVYSVNQTLLGRGINVAIVDSHTKSVIKIEHFDTYEFGKNRFSVFFQLAFVEIFSCLSLVQ